MNGVVTAFGTCSQGFVRITAGGWRGRAGPGWCGRPSRGPAAVATGAPLAPRRALRTRKCSSNRRSRVQNAPLECEMHISTSRGPAITSWASAAPAPPRSIFGDPTRRGAAILISSEAVARRSGSARSWAGADPSPACAMRAQRNEIRLGSHHASSARQNPPALNPREPAAHNAIPGDITKTTPPGAGEGRVFPGGRRGPHAPWEGVRSSAPWLPVPCVRTGSQPRRGATVDVAPPRER